MKIKTASLLLLFTLLAALGGGCKCFKYVTKDYGYQRPMKFSDPSLAKHDFTAHHDAPNYFRKEYDSWMANTVDTNASINAKRERDAILSELMFMIDGAHGEFERDTRAIKSTADFVAELAVLGVTSAGAVAGGAATKAVLSAVAGGIVGSKLAVNKELLAQQAMEAIQAQMRANMQLRKATIITNMTNTVDKYPLELGLSDVANYYYDGTMARALQNMVQTAKEKEKEADKSVQEAIKSKN